MIRRPLVAAAAVSAILLPAASGPHGDAAVAARRPSVQIGRATASPRSLSGSGGTVTLRVTINARNGAIINSVASRSTLSGSSAPGTASTLQSVGRNVYTGTVRVPRNTLTSRNTAYLSVEVQSSVGPVMKTRAAKITLGPGSGGGDGPPPPPDI